MWILFVLVLLLGAFLDGKRDGIIWHEMRTKRKHRSGRHWHLVKFGALTAYCVAGGVLVGGYGLTIRAMLILAFTALATGPVMTRTMRYTNYGKLYPDIDDKTLFFWWNRDRFFRSGSISTLKALDLFRVLLGLAVSYGIAR